MRRLGAALALLVTACLMGCEGHTADNLAGQVRVPKNPYHAAAGAKPTNPLAAGAAAPTDKGSGALK